MSTTQHAIVTGGGSGVGQAVALSLIERGYAVSIVGRRAEALQRTIAKAGKLADRLAAYALDVADTAAVASAVARMRERNGRIDALVNAAGSNVRERRLEVLSEADWQAVLGANLSGAFHTVHAVLPTMRRQASGTIVNIISEAGWSATPKAGAAYVASKFGLAGLTQAINLEEQPHGIRATAIYPGDINTPLLDKRPQPPPPEARANMLQAEDVAACVLLAIELPSRAVIEELLVRPRAV
ncbi:MAG TPA: SDR family oxidoreductase [Polyangiaceae bacterium]|nr:SDR family oxidoreductase [Polyangiaceae bacterium]